ANRVRWEIEYPRRSNNGGATLVLNVPRSVELLLSTVSASQDISQPGALGDRISAPQQQWWRDAGAERAALGGAAA
ncbi:hypothetical protein C7E14_23060, partial [Stenotrophomonas maltophilia]